ncbi:MAG TPA: hypothetical protein VL742_20000 [Casimicrobiaceae bacterium]|nr:hypothetical protein [Casimicrobiaceae bacterium]
MQGSLPPVPDAGTQKFVAPAAAKSKVDDNSGLRTGTIEAVNPAGGTFDVHGQGMTFDPKRVKVYSRSGKPASLSSLRKGSVVRFTLDPTDVKHRRVSVLYVD